jgi:hypothetical protein
MVGATAMFAAGSLALGQSAPPLGAAASFVALGNSSVTNTGNSRITGNVGVSPGDVATGFSSAVFRVGNVRRDDALARQARNDSDHAAETLAAQPCTNTLQVADLGGKTLLPGVHCFALPDVALHGTLILDAAGNRDAVWILRIDGTLTAESDASVLVVGNGYDGNVFWSTGGATTLGARTAFVGNVFAASVTLEDGASISGRLFARPGAVALHANKVSLCCSPFLLAPASLPDGVLGLPYRQTVTASGGRPPYTFTRSSGSLPAGLSLAPAGTIEGTPQTAGAFALTITATDSLGCSSSIAYNLRSACGVTNTTPLAIEGVSGPCSDVDVPALSPWMLLAFSILLAGAGWFAIGRR